MGCEAVIVAYGRSAICKARKGSFANTHPVDYAAQVLNGVLKKVPQMGSDELEDVIVGCAMQTGRSSMNMAKLIAARARLPQSVCGQTINRFCASSLQAVATASNAILAGMGTAILAGGAEDMSGSFAPYPETFMEPWLVQNDPGAYMAMGITAENIATRYNITRSEMDKFAVTSHMKAAEAQVQGKLQKSIIPVTVKKLDSEVVVTQDEGIRRDSTVEVLSKLKPCFRPDNGTITAATSSQSSDGAAFVLLMERSRAKELGIRPIARLRSFAVAGCDSTVMGLGPIYATPKALRRANLTLADMHGIELNEAFAAQAISCMRELTLDPDKVNPYGGAIALGHPLGATGAILVCKLLDRLIDTGGRYGLVTMCIGGGMGAAGIFEIL